MWCVCICVCDVYVYACVVCGVYVYVYAGAVEAHQSRLCGVYDLNECVLCGYMLVCACASVVCGCEKC